MILDAKSLGSWVGDRKLTFFVSWVVLCSPSLLPRAALARGRPDHLRHDTLQCGHAGSVQSLTRQQDSMGWMRYRVGLKL